MTPDVFGIVGTKQAGVFRVERVVAEGGFAVVYRAIHEGFRSPVALKCLKVPDTTTEAARAAFLEKFREEGELLFRLSALVPAVVRPLHVDVLSLDGGRIVPFLALEWLDGEGLDRIVDRRRAAGQPPLSVQALVELLQPAALALAQAHRLPTPDGPVAVIHRDLKPENLFVLRIQDAFTVKILDFGIARTRSAATLHAGRVTENAALDAFTPGYAAPEQWLPKRYGGVGPWTDVFGLALTMVEAILGRPPIDGDLAAMMGTTTDLVRRPTPRTEGAPVSDAVEAAFARALAVDPRERTQTIDAFWSELEEAVGLPPSIRIAGAPMSSRSLAAAISAPPGAMALAQTQLAPAPRVSPAAMTVQAPDSAPRPQISPSAMTVEVQRNAPPPRAVPPRPPPPAPKPAASAPPPRPAAPQPIAFELAAPVRVREENETLAAPGTEQGRTFAEFRALLRLPAQIVIVALVLSATDWIYMQRVNDTLALGGVRPVWIAGPLALLGVGLACWRIVNAL
ncbi:MAG: protein kinase [Minicystis sp.]